MFYKKAFVRNIPANIQKKIAVYMTMILTVVFLSGSAQGVVHINEKGSFLGAMEFLPNSQLSKGYQRVRSAFMGATDPLVDPKKDYTENGETVSGMVRDAVLFFEWWTTGESPLERYQFKWTPSGYYSITYTNDKGNTEYKRVDRGDLEKYPNLLKWFDRIQPTYLNFEFSFSSGDIPDDQYNSFRTRYSILEDLGSAGYSVVYHRKINGGFIPYTSSGPKDSWTAPSLLLGGWDEFLNFPSDLNSKKDKLIELFKMGRSVNIADFKLTTIKWPISLMKYIAVKLDKYQKGEEAPSPADSVNAAAIEKKSGEDTWDQPDMVDADTDPFYDKTVDRYGIKSKKGIVLKAAEYDRIVKNPKTRQFLASKGKTVYVLNSMGGVLASKTLSTSSFYTSSCPSNGNLYVEISLPKPPRSNDFQTTNIYLTEVYTCDANGFKGPEKLYRVEETGYGLTLESDDDHRTEAQKRADEQRVERERRAEVRSAASYCASLGYKDEKTSNVCK